MTCCVLPYVSHIGMCCPKGWGFCAVLARNECFVHFGFKSGLVFKGSSREGFMKLFILVIPIE